MRVLFTAVLALVWLASKPAVAHDFWIEPENFDVPAGGPARVTAKVGHGAEMAPWPTLATRIVGLRSLGPDGLRDHRTDVHPEGSGQITLRGLDDGAYVVFLESTNSFSELPAEKFNAYVEEEGILPIALHRAQPGSRAGPGRELYSRRGKTLIKIGSGVGSRAHMTNPVGLTLEIVPGQDPFRYDGEKPFSVSVLYLGRPIAGATLHVTRLDQPEIRMILKTDSQGVASVDSLDAGTWLFHTIWSQPVEDLLSDAQYSTVFSSLTFRID